MPPTLNPSSTLHRRCLITDVYTIQQRNGLAEKIFWQIITVSGYKIGPKGDEKTEYNFSEAVKIAIETADTFHELANTPPKASAQPEADTPPAKPLSALS